jgi:hypothetical protein
MAIQFACSCGRKLQADEEQLGRLVRCPACGAETTVPSGGTAVQPVEALPPGTGPVQAEEPPRAERDEPRRRRHREDDDDDEYEDRPRSDKKGTNVAVVLLVGCLGFFLIIGVLIALLIPAVQKVREAAARIQSQNNLRQMALGMENYSDANGHLPEAVPDPKLKGPTKLSWRVELLPYLEEDILYRQFHLDEEWDSPHNKALLTSMPKVFAHPNHPQENAQGLTYYRVFVGEHTPFPPGKRTSIPADFPDGLANTILVIEAADPVPWTKPDELVYDPNQPLPRLGGHFPRGTNAAMADGAGVFLRVGNGLSEQTLRNAIDPNDGKPLGADWP